MHPNSTDEIYLIDSNGNILIKDINNSESNFLPPTEEYFNQYRMVFDHNKLNSKAIREILTIAYDSYYKRFTWLFKYTSYVFKK